MHPIVPVFVKLTLVVAAAITLFVVLTFVMTALFKIILIAALVAAAILGGLFLYNAIARRRLPAGR